MHLFEPNNLFKSSYMLLSNNGGMWLLSLVLNVFMIHWRTEDEPVLSQRRSQSAWRERDVLSSFRWSVCAALRSCWNVSGMLQCTLGNGCFQLQPWVTNGNHAMTEEASGLWMNLLAAQQTGFSLSLPSTDTHYTWPYIRAAALRSEITPSTHVYFSKRWIISLRHVPWLIWCGVWACNFQYQNVLNVTGLQKMFTEKIMGY